MSSGHKHSSAPAHGALLINRLFKNDTIRERLYQDHTINHEYDLPYLAGYSNDGKTIYIDRHIPDELTLENDGNKRQFSAIPHLRDHEVFEKTLIDVLKWSYAHAHEAATAYERRGVLSSGLPWKQYQNLMHKYVKAAEHELLVKVPPDLDMTPYYAPPVDRRLIAHMQQAMGHGVQGKQTKTAVEYSNEGHPGSHCGPVKLWPKGQCEHFSDPNGCKLVQGWINPKGWCCLWEAK